MASIYRHRNAWQASVTVAGTNKKQNFRTRKEAETWAAQLHGELQQAHAPLLGGPAKATVGRTLYEYAHLYTIHKRGAKQEINLINRYLLAAGLPTLQLQVTEQGGVDLTDAPPATELPFSFAGLRAKRAASREKTNAFRAGLSVLPVVQVSAQTMLRFMSAMRKDGLTDSTIQKELALLKHAFNCAQKHWNWAGFENPMANIAVPKGGPGRCAVLDEDAELALFDALGRCDNPFILPIVQFAIETTSRRGSLLRLRWRDVDLPGRTATLRLTKAGENQIAPLTQRAVEILSRLPRDDDDARVFPMTADALDSAWDRATTEAGLPDLRFHDLRHVGTTRHARRLRNPQMLASPVTRRTRCSRATRTCLWMTCLMHSMPPSPR
ncbi:site-specific integrase [Paraburkholderia sp. BL10I2N1]|uniref:site-specific integrase n=1 Tax=Paraburkholderia sp. BL10I2N1 TaxID=1938796 RepID=UPI00105F3AA1|nr:site-specific integrase [Paraburkholderia sp. BL10I2N1]TDN67421.1 phage integrase family protein [Paraburkholderia sp. BL10I2N1]